MNNKDKSPFEVPDDDKFPFEVPDCDDMMMDTLIAIYSDLRSLFLGEMTIKELEKRWKKEVGL
jgi:hypothetical protein